MHRHPALLKVMMGPVHRVIRHPIRHPLLPTNTASLTQVTQVTHPTLLFPARCRPMACSEVVVLAGGVSVLRDALSFALALEARGFRFGVRGDGRLEVQPSDALTPDDCSAIR